MYRELFGWLTDGGNIILKEVVPVLMFNLENVLHRDIQALRITSII